MNAPAIYTQGQPIWEKNIKKKFRSVWPFGNKGWHRSVLRQVWVWGEESLPGTGSKNDASWTQGSTPETLPQGSSPGALECPLSMLTVCVSSTLLMVLRFGQLSERGKNVIRGEDFTHRFALTPCFLALLLILPILNSRSQEGGSKRLAFDPLADAFFWC